LDFKTAVSIQFCDFPSNMNPLPRIQYPKGFCRKLAATFNLQRHYQLPGRTKTRQQIPSLSAMRRLDAVSWQLRPNPKNIKNGLSAKVSKNLNRKHRQIFCNQQISKMTQHKKMTMTFLSPVTSSKWLCILFVGLAICNASHGQEQSPDDISPFISNKIKLTFDGLRTGEGYYRGDGSRMVFQSEREEGNPFYQIYMVDLETGDTQRISPGHGKTTCAWIHPTAERVMFASTHDDPQARAKQIELLKLRESGNEPRYAWDYDETFDIYHYDLDSKEKKYTNLTNTRGYDAEGSYSPDGKLIAFASNRLAYTKKLTEREAKLFEVDKSFMMDLFIMDADGKNVKQLTTEPGYDGGPFFSPDGKRICWRHFSEDGLQAEIWTMNIDGTDKKQLTKMGAMSWAPFYHPSGEYLIFNTNVHGFSNFELYMVDTDGKAPPVRVTNQKGFDGLATFTPDGNTITWTWDQAEKKQSQLFTGKWNHKAALQAIGESKEKAQKNRVSTSAEFRPEDVLRHVQKLCQPEMEGRLTGSRGERLATEYVAAYFSSLGMKPAGDKSENETQWFQYFDFPSGTSLGGGNSLSDSETEFKLDVDWRPLSFSGLGKSEPAEVVFAGYGISAPKSDEQEEYDSYVHLDVKEKWVIVLRYLPEDISPERRQFLQYYSTLRRKARVARDKGAKGMIIVSGPTSNVRSQLIPLQGGSTRDAISMPVVSVTDSVAEKWLAKYAARKLEKTQKDLDSGDMAMGFPLKGFKLAASIDIDQKTGKGRNVMGRLQAGEKPSEQVIVIGAHIDHLGRGNSGSSLARENEQGQVHAGADDNASGVAAMMEIAEYLADQKKRGKLKLRRDIVFAAWSGEELNLYGSKHFVAEMKKQLAVHAHNPHATDPHNPHAAPPKRTETKPANPHAVPKKDDVHAVTNKPGSIYPTVAAYVNLDMVGRFDKALILQGLGSSDYWRPVIERRNVVAQLNLKLSDDTNLPTDAREFYGAGVPIIAAFTGSHSDYHSPRDTPEKLNYDKTAQIAKLLALITRDLVQSEKIPTYKEYEQVAEMPRGGMRATLGTVPDYGDSVKGVLVGDSRPNTPAAKAGIKSGDVVVELAGKKVENIYDYTDAINALKVGQKTKIVIMRGEKRISLDITPISRD